jgi:hypothetical protein
MCQPSKFRSVYSRENTAKSGIYPPAEMIRSKKIRRGDSDILM